MTEPKVKLYSTPHDEDCILWSEHDLQEIVISSILEECRYDLNREVARNLYYKENQTKSSSD